MALEQTEAMLLDNEYAHPPPRWWEQLALIPMLLVTIIACVFVIIIGKWED